jgi:hypothetical protein
MKTVTLIAALIVAALPALPAIANAQSQTPERVLPPFTLVNGGGAATPSTTLSAGGRAVLVFVKPSCRPCEQLLDALARIDDPGLAPRLVLVVEAPLEDAAAFAARRLPPQLASVRWFADAQNAAWTALDLKGLPMVIGIEGEKIAWTHNGAPHHGLLEPLMRTWIGSVESAEVSR